MKRLGTFSLGVCLSMTGCGDGGDPSQHVFLPAAEANLSVSSADGHFDEALDAFAKQKGFSIERANYPKNNREVDHVEIYKNSAKKTFILLTNRKSPDLYECSAYSHEGEAWRSMWGDFLAFAKGQAGKDSVHELSVDAK